MDYKFTPNVYKVGSEASCADDMISAGYIQKFNTTDDWGTMKDGKIEQVYSDNHSTVEDYGSIDGLCAPGYLVKVDYDLYSAAALEKEKNKGTDMSEIDTTGQYWLLYLVRENEETGYILALNTKNYTKEDMLAWAQSFQFQRIDGILQRRFKGLLSAGVCVYGADRCDRWFRDRNLM